MAADGAVEIVPVVRATVVIGVSEIVPDDVMGLDEPVRPVPTVMDVTVPAPASVDQDGLAPVPPDDKTCPDRPGDRGCQAEADRYSNSPCVFPMMLSRMPVMVFADGAALEPEIFAKRVLLATAAREIVPDV